MTRLSIDIPNKLHHFLKVHTAHKNINKYSAYKEMYKKLNLI